MRNIPTELVLLQIAEGLQTLVKNPDLSKIIQDTYTLMDSERTKADESRQIIANADKFLAGLKSKQDALANIDERISEAEKLENFNSDSLREIAKEKAKIIKDAQKNADDAVANAQEKKRLDGIAIDLQSKLKDAKEKEDRIKRTKDILKKRSEIMAAPLEEIA